MSTFAPKRILCPVDFSDQSASALRVAGTIAHVFASEVIVLHVQRLEAPVYFTLAQTQALEAQLRRSNRSARKHASEFARQNLPARIESRVIIANDDPVNAILKAQHEHSADLIAMGTHGRSGLARVRLGSIAESILHQAEVPILTVGPRVKRSAAPGSIQQVLCPVNFRPGSQAALEHAAALAGATGAVLTIAHIDEALDSPTTAAAMHSLCDGIPATVRQHCTVKEVVKQGAAAAQIVHEVEASQVDLLVIGSHPRNLLGSVLLGSTTETVIRSASCPVLSVRASESKSAV